MSRWRPKVKSGQTLDVEQLYIDHRRAVLLFLARRTADPQIALDLWAETFAQAYANRRSYRGTSTEEAAAWLMTIARRELAQFYRRGAIEQRGMEKLRLERPATSMSLLEEVDRAAGIDGIRRELGEALQKLSSPVREAVRLRIVDDLEYDVVARRLGISEGAARVRVSRGLSALADLLDDFDSTTVTT